MRAAPALCLALLAASARPAPAAPDAPARPQTTAAQKSMLSQMQDAFTRIAEAVEPTVVNIKAERLRPGEGESDGGLGGPPGPPGRGRAGGPPRRAEATGSGVIVRADGYILTNDHVVEGASGGRVTVTLADGREFSGRVFPDFKSDLAVVKIDPGPDPLPTAAFGDSALVRPGQWAIAVGSPFDLQNTMTVGVISAVGRRQSIGAGANARYYPDLLQTDAAINPGNSGGPLFSIDGKVVGINVAIESPVEGSAGVGFAIPSGVAQQVMAALIGGGQVTRGYLGLAPEDLSPVLQAQTGRKEGAFVRDVRLDGPAGRAGLEAGDVVTAWGGQPVTGEVSLRGRISATPPGRTVTLSYVRDGAAGTLPVTLGSAPRLPSDDAAAPAAPPAPFRLGLTVRDQTAADRVSLGLPPGTSGVVITRVAPGSAAEAAGLSAGSPVMLLQKLGGQPVTSAAGFARAAAAPSARPGPARAGVPVVVLSVVDNQVHQTALTLRP